VHKANNSLAVRS